MEALKLSLIVLLLVFVVPPGSLSINAKLCNPSDEKILLQLKADYGNPDALGQWTPETDCCSEWYGVFCNSNNRVRAMNVLNELNVKGTIPSYVANLTYLESLSFRKLPNLVGTIPESITQLKYLNFLWISWTNVTGFPDFLYKIPTLTYINLSFNNMTGTIPSSLSTLANVNYINLSRNKLTGTIPQSFGSFKQGSNFYLTLSHNQLTGSIPDSLTKLTLHTFDVSYNKLCGKIPQGGSLQSFKQDVYLHNKCLCGSPLSACK